MARHHEQHAWLGPRREQDNRSRIASTVIGLDRHRSAPDRRQALHGWLPRHSRYGEFQAPVGESGEWSFDFSLSLNGFEGNTVKATLQVPPPPPPEPPIVAKNDFYTLKRNGDRTFNAGGNDSVKTWGSGSGVTVTLGSISCGYWNTSNSDLANGDLTIHTYGNSSGCQATYTLEKNGKSSTATVYYDVTRNG